LCFKIEINYVVAPEWLVAFVTDSTDPIEEVDDTIFGAVNEAEAIVLTCSIELFSVKTVS
jgi:hypothetical protein